MPVVFRAFFGKPNEVLLNNGSPNQNSGLQEAPAIMVVPLVITAIFSVLMGLYPDYFLNIVKAVDPKYLIHIVKAAL